MKKLIRGIIEYRQSVRPQRVETFAKLALGQKPDALLVTCSDSRVAPNVFASTDPGDLFVVRNVGNLVQPVDDLGQAIGGLSGAAAIEFALRYLPVSDVIVCGHSECGAMIATLNGLQDDTTPNLQDWLRSGKRALERLEREGAPDPSLARHNQLSQVNALVQLDHVRGYPHVRKRLDEGSLRLHAWWFDIANADVYAYEPERGQFVLLDETEAEAIMARL